MACELYLDFKKSYVYGSSIEAVLELYIELTLSSHFWKRDKSKGFHFSLYIFLYCLHFYLPIVYGEMGLWITFVFRFIFFCI